MSLKVIYITRHGFRSNWAVNRNTGSYTSSIPSPTGIPSDPALASYGVLQANELAAKLVSVTPRIERWYSSPWFRCLQTLNPALDRAEELRPGGLKGEYKIRVEHGLGEWFGRARFEHPTPAGVEVLKGFFPRVDAGYGRVIVPDVRGESLEALHDRVAYALERVVEECDREGVRAVVICSHAAAVIAMGRVLTGNMPEDVGVEDFKAFCCGLSTFVRKGSGAEMEKVEEWQGVGSPIPKVSWRGGKGVGGGWDCEINCDCSFLSGGEERGWRFSGDESFITPGNDAALDAGAGLGIVVEGNKASKVLPSKSARL